MKTARLESSRETDVDVVVVVVVVVVAAPAVLSEQTKTYFLLTFVLSLFSIVV
jgi:hypothetical protein